MNEKDLICPICGEPTSVWYGNARKDRLCRKHAQEFKDGLIEQCEDCGEWHEKGKYCKCKIKNVKVDFSNINTNDVNLINKDAAELTCIICGEPSNGKHFCKKCYNRYKNKEILLRIKNCVFPCGEPLDESYEGVYECDDGHIVKSIAEQTIDNYLCENAIFHGYELPLDIGTDKPLKPDFCLKNYLGKDEDVYIEYFGLKGNPEYDKKTAYKMEHYRKKHITLICLYPNTDLKNLKFALQTKLQKEKIKKGQVLYAQD